MLSASTSSLASALSCQSWTGLWSSCPGWPMASTLPVFMSWQTSSANRALEVSGEPAAVC